MSDVSWERYPLLAQMPQARSWLAMQANLGRAPNTVEAYGLPGLRSVRRRKAARPPLRAERGR